MSNFHRVWIASGIISGAGIATADALLYEHNPLALILTGVLTGTLSGFILGFIAHNLFRSKKGFCLRIIGIVILLVVIGFILNIGYFIGVSKIPHGQWSQLPSPPEKPVRFLGQSGFNFFGGIIYVETGTKNIYSFSCYSLNPCDWKKVDNLPSGPEKNIEVCPPGSKWSYATPLLLFKKVIDRFKVNICGADYTIQQDWIIVDDGTIWYWDRYFSAMEPIFFIAASLIISVLAGILGSLVLLIKRKKHEITIEA